MYVRTCVLSGTQPNDGSPFRVLVSMCGCMSDAHMYITTSAPITVSVHDRVIWLIRSGWGFCFAECNLTGALIVMCVSDVKSGYPFM